MFIQATEEKIVIFFHIANNEHNPLPLAVKALDN